MENFEKILKDFETGDDSNNIFSDSEKILFKTFSLVKKISNSLKDNQNSCEHDIEDICAYFEKNLDENSIKEIEERIFSCDNCFSIYSYLENQIDEIKIEEPAWLLDKVIINEIKTITDENEKKNIFSIIVQKLKNNYAITGSGFAVAILALVFIITPLNQSKFAKDDKMEIAQAPSQVRTESLMQKSPEKPGALKKESAIREIEITQPHVFYKTEKKPLPVAKQKSKPSDNEEKKPDLMQDKIAFYDKKTPEAPKVIIESKRNVPEKPAVILPKTEANKEEEPIIIAKMEPKEETSVISSEDEQTIPPVSVNEPKKNAMPEQNEELKAKDSLQKYDKNISAQEGIIAGKQNTISATALKTLSAKPSSEIESFINVEIKTIFINKPGFVVIKNNTEGKPGEVIGNIKIDNPGKYENLKIKIKHMKDLKKVFMIIYEDSNNNGIFDNSDKEQSKPEVIELNNQK